MDGAVEDLAAEVFLVAWRRQHDMPSHVLPWLLNIAGKCLANEHRGLGRRRAVTERVTHERGEATGTEAALVVQAQRRAGSSSARSPPAPACTAPRGACSASCGPAWRRRASRPHWN